MLPKVYDLIISIHALRGEGDRLAKLRFLRTITFQSTPSVGRATTISIHALRGEGDNRRTTEIASTAISIHALRGEGDIYFF